MINLSDAFSLPIGTIPCFIRLKSQFLLEAFFVLQHGIVILCRKIAIPCRSIIILWRKITKV